MIDSHFKGDNVIRNLISLTKGKDISGELHQFAKELAREGVSQDLLLEYFEELRLNVDEETEDIVLEVMDLIAGFCSSSKRIYGE